MKFYTKRLIKFAEKMNEKWVFRGEFTEDLEEYFQSIHENLVLLYREVNGFDKPLIHQYGLEGEDAKPFILKSISDMQKLLKAGRFLRFDFNREYDVIDHALNKIDFVINILGNSRPVLPNAFRYANEIKHALEQSSDLFDRQSPVLDKSIRVDPTLMTDRDPRDPDQISDEELHPSFQQMSGMDDD